MLYSCYAGFNVDTVSLKKYINHDELKYLPNASVIVDKNEELEILCDAFTMTLKDGSSGGNTALSIQFASEDYGLEFRYQMFFTILHDYPQWAEVMMTFLGKLLRRYQGDCVLQADGGLAIVMRKQTYLIVDDTVLSGAEKFPFSYLNQDYVTGSIEQC